VSDGLVVSKPMFQELFFVLVMKELSGVISIQARSAITSMLRSEKQPQTE
jgi:hypothetical protein